MKVKILAAAGAAGSVLFWITDLTTSIPTIVCSMLDSNDICNNYAAANKKDFILLEQRVIEGQDNILNNIEKALYLAALKDNSSPEFAAKLDTFKESPSVENAKELLLLSQNEPASLPIIKRYINAMLPQYQWGNNINEDNKNKESGYSYGALIIDTENGSRKNASNYRDKEEELTDQREVTHTRFLAKEQTYAQLTELESNNLYRLDNYKEKLSSVDFISATRLFGIQVPTNEDLSIGQSLYLFKPRDFNQIFIAVRSIDDVYSATFDINFDNSVDGWQKITLPTQYIRELSEYSQQELLAVALVQASEAGKKNYDLFLPTSWGKPSGAPPYLLIEDYDYLASYKIQYDVQSCLEISSNKKRIAYNYYCPWSEKFLKGVNLIIVNSGNYRVWVE